MAMENREVEFWRNQSAGKAVVRKFDQFGQERHELVASGMQVQVTSQEREMLNQERTVDVKNDIFSNGVLVPVRLIGDTAEQASNPNHMGESDLKNLFSEFPHWKAFESQVSKITSETALRRLLELAESDEVDATLKQVNILNEKITDISGSATVKIEHAGKAGPEDRKDMEFKAYNM